MTTQLLGIFGWPIEHSQSPKMHRAALTALNIDALYAPFAVMPEQLTEAVHGLRALGIRGVNVTVPHKESIMAHLDELSPAARAIGAVNTVIQKQPGHLYGDNTDALGLVRALSEEGISLEGTRIAIVGAGGAARAACVGFMDAQAKHIDIIARRYVQAEQLSRSLQAHAAHIPLQPVDLAEARQSIAAADILIQATHATMTNAEDPNSITVANRLVEALHINALPQHAVVMDMVYSPRQTLLLQAASKHARRTLNGLGMLLHQGALAFEYFTGQQAPIQIMRDALQN